MWYYVTETENTALSEAARRLGIELRVQRQLPPDGTPVLLERRDVPRSAVRGLCIGINREEPYETAGWSYAVQEPYDAMQVLRIAATLSDLPIARNETDAAAKCFSALSVPTHLLGFRYLCAAVSAVGSATEADVSVMDEIYPIIAKRFGTSPIMVSRAIRHAIDRAWRDGDRAAQRSYLGYTAADTRGIPTNSEFLFCVCERLRLLS